MATSLPRRKSTAPGHDTKPKIASSTFRPKFPLDPFAAATARDPWFIRPDVLPSPTTSLRRDVLLVLGAPSTTDLEPLLSSKYLANSLLILATHQPPAIPHTTQPTVRILKLTEPLSIEHAGAVRFVNVLEWAERVARLWRKHGGFGAAQLAEESDGHEFLPPPSLWKKGTQSMPPSPRSSASNLSSLRASNASGFLTTDPSSSFSRARPHSMTRLLSRARTPSLPAVDPSQRPFDALINYLPPTVPDKSLLKQAILVTTISRPFLIASSPRPAAARLSSRSATSVYLPPTPPFQSGDSLPSSLFLPPARAHIIHVLPSSSYDAHAHARSKLVQSLEGFLLSFGFPTALDGARAPDDADRPRPFIMPSSSLGEPLGSAAEASTSPYGAWPQDCSLVELVLCGSLDGDDPYTSGGGGGSPQGARILAQNAPRALLVRPADVVVLAEDAASPPAVTVSQSDPGYYGGGGGATAKTKTKGSGSPLAKGDLYALPTPPDSEESGAESSEPVYFGRSDTSVGAGAGAGGREGESREREREAGGGQGEGMVKKSRWKFWKREGRRGVVA
ncbi:hypothetical protein BDW22DRAFT_756460 [Trametopsis cervina]|nr:hypothetical protein BDW22DRAFT_756460 [Trametopsis cervina]